MPTGKQRSRATDVLHRAGILLQGVADASSVHYVRVSDVFRGRLAWDDRIDVGLLAMTGNPEIVAEVRALQYEIRRDYLLNELGELAGTTI